MQSEKFTHFPSQVAETNNYNILKIQSLVYDNLIKIEIEHSPEEK